MDLIKCCKRFVLWHIIGVACIFVSTPNFPCFILKESYMWQAPSSSNIAITWRGRKNHIGTWSSHRNKNSTAMKSINFRVSHQVEEITHWIFNMGGCEFYIETSRTTQVLRKTHFWRRWAWKVPTILVYPLIVIVSVSPFLLLLCPCSPHIVVIVPHRNPLLLYLCPYIIIVM